MKELSRRRKSLKEINARGGKSLISLWKMEKKREENEKRTIQGYNYLVGYLPGGTKSHLLMYSVASISKQCH